MLRSIGLPELLALLILVAILVGIVKMSRRKKSRIAFDRTGEHVPGCPVGIYTINPNGSDCRQIRTTGESPRWSPDGKWLAFVEGTKDNGGLPSVFIMRPNGEDVRRLTSHHDVSATPPCWSPDSKQLGYSLWLWSEKRYELCIVEIATKKWKHVIYLEDEVYPVWSHSNKLMFSLPGEATCRRLFEVDPNGQSLKESAVFAPGDNEPIWTHDGGKVVFGQDNGLVVMDADGGRKQVIRCEGVPIQWAIAPDGESVAYAAQETGSVSGFEIFVLGLNGQPKRRLVNNPIVDDHEVDSRYVSWSPYL
jgi:Tol biopolymer transport system component